jgi:hypothetical protein
MPGNVDIFYRRNLFYKNRLRQADIEHPFTQYLWPVSVKFYNPFPAIYLCQVPKLPKMKEPQTFFVRDGTISASWFFSTYPEPGKFKDNLLLNYRIAPYVPKEWGKQVRFYRLASLSNQNQRKNNLLITGLMSRNYVSIDHAEKIVESLKQETYKDVKIYCVPKYWGHGDEHDHAYSFQFASTILNANLGQISFIEWTGYEFFDQFHNYRVVDFSENFLCSDSYLVHYAAAKGSEILSFDNCPYQVEKRFELSQFHWIEVLKKVPHGQSSEELTKDLGQDRNYLERESSFERSSANDRFPWPLWYSDWFKYRLKSKN